MYISKAALITFLLLLLALLLLLLFDARLLGFLLCGPRALLAQLLILLRNPRLAGLGFGATAAGTEETQSVHEHSSSTQALH